METEQSVGPTKNCPKCGELILASAKRCKHCQADLRNWFARHKVLTGLGLFIVLIIILVSVGGDKDKSENTTTSSSNESGDTKKAEQVVYKVNEPIKSDSVELTITSIQEKKQVGSEYFQSNPSEGGTYVAVQWKYKNTSDKPIGMFSHPRINLVDSAGTSYDADIDASGNYATEIKLDRKIVSDLNPGITVNDASVFEVSKESYAKGEWSLMIKSDNKEYKVSID